MKKQHIKWTVIVGLIAMLLAIGGYILSLDDSNPYVVKEAVDQAKSGK
ncbi:MAG: hypothetical protein WC889_14055 [Myxococcota bacterium]|jgi:hypothetical protein